MQSSIPKQLSKKQRRAALFRQNNTKSTDIVKSYFGKPLKEGITSLNGSLIGFPDRLRVKLKWDDEYTFQGSPFTGNVYRGNSVFDPDFTGVFSNSPAYYTALKTVYGQYCVLGAKITAQFNNEGSIASEGVLWASDQNIGSTTFQQMAESKRCKVLELGPATGQGRGRLSMACSSEEMQGQKHLESDSNNYSSLSANPTDPWFFGVYVRTVDATNVNIYCRVIIEMDVVLKELVSYAAAADLERKSATPKDIKDQRQPMPGCIKRGQEPSVGTPELSPSQVLNSVKDLLTKVESKIGDK